MTMFEFVPSDAEERIIEYIKEHGQATPMEIAENLDISMARTYRLLKQQYDRQKLERKEVGWEIEGESKRKHLIYLIKENKHGRS